MKAENHLSGKKFVRELESLKGRRFYIGSEIRSQFGKINEEEYISKVNTPARDARYFLEFHQPAVERASQRVEKGASTKVMAVACGFSYELDFLKDTPHVELYGFDIAAEPLEVAQSRIQNGHFFTYDVRKRVPPAYAREMDVVIAVNAMIYSPDDMLQAMRDFLKPGGEAVVNFRPFSAPLNKEFYDYYVQTGGKIVDSILHLRNEQDFLLKVVDYRTCADETDQKKDRQVYFQDTDEIRRFVRAMNFEIADHRKFYFQSPQNSKNDIDVFTLRKPE